jgi:type II secretory pathway pseudopilin PulG
MFKTLNNASLRPAIAMIELVFAIVIIGIALLSAPRIIGQSVKSINTALNQEAIAAAASQISLVLTYPWDENTSSTIGGSGILRVAGGSPALSFGIRDTNFTRQYNALGSGFENASARLGLDADDVDGPDDLDDFNNAQPIKLKLYADEEARISNNEGEYIDKTIIMTNQVVYGADVTTDYTSNPVQFNNPFQASSTSTDIKIVTVNLVSDSGADEYEKNINLSAFSCNIGTSRLITNVNMRNLP